MLRLRSRRELAGHHEEHKFNLVAKANLDRYPTNARMDRAPA